MFKMEKSLPLLLIICKLSLSMCNKGTYHFVTYPGFGDLAITCNDSDVINITGVELTNHSSQCSGETCTLSDNDKLAIKKCNDNSTCMVPVHNMSACITERGLYNVRYSCKSTNHFVAYQGFGDLVLTCNDSGVINITGFELTSYSSQCSDETCTLSDSDKLTLQNCNDKSTCKISVHNVSDCLTDRGFYNVRYSCEVNASTSLTSCDFDNNTCEIQHVTGNREWKVVEAQTAGFLFRDHTTLSLNGQFMFVETQETSQTKLIDLVPSSPEQILSLYYWTNTDTGYIELQRESKDGYFDSVTKFPIANNVWTQFKINLTDMGDYYLHFKATGYTLDSKFLIDDITIKNEISDHIQYQHTCRNLNEVTLLDECHRAFVENVDISVDPLKGRCKDFVAQEANQICDVSGDSIYCDARQMVNKYPSCFNLNTLLINYTCKDHTQFDQTCRKLDEAIGLDECHGSFVENVNIDFDFMKEHCKQFVDEEKKHICKVGSDSLYYCDARQVLKRYPECFNLNTLMINYTCKEDDATNKATWRKANSENIGMTVGIVIGPLLVVGLLIMSLFIYRHHTRQINAKRQTIVNDHSVLMDSDMQVTSLKTQSNRLESNKLSSVNTDTNPEVSNEKPRCKTAWT